MLGPLLFILFFNAIIKGMTAVEVALYADDIAAWTASKNIDELSKKLQEFLNHIEGWLAQYRVKLNVSKTVYTVFSRRREPVQLSLLFSGAALGHTTTPKFLGITLDTQFTFKHYVSDLVARCEKRLSMLRSLSGRTWGMSEKLLLATFRSLIRSLIDYAPIIIINLPKSSLEKLELIQRKASRIITRSHPRAPTAELFERLRLTTIETRAAELSIAYWDKALIENVLIQELYGAYRPHAAAREGVERASQRTTIIGRILELKGQ